MSEDKTKAKLPLTAAIALLASIGGIGGGFGGGYYGAGGLPERVDKIDARLIALETDFEKGKALHYELVRRVQTLEADSKNGPLVQLQIDVGILKKALERIEDKLK